MPHTLWGMFVLNARRRIVFVCVTATALLGCNQRNGSTSTGPGDDGGSATDASVADGSSMDAARTSDTAVAEADAEPDTRNRCEPGTRSCAAGIARSCGTDGREIVTDCDPEMGLECRPEGCTGACSLEALGSNYYGCDFFPTIAPNVVYVGFKFAIAVAAATPDDTNIIVTRGTEELARRTLSGTERVAVIELPWDLVLKGAAASITPDQGMSRKVESGAFRVRTSRPATVYQFNPLTFTLPDPQPADCPRNTFGVCASFSNDASLLFPAHTLSRRYKTLGWRSSMTNAVATLTFTGVTDGTDVTLAAPTRAPDAGTLIRGGTTVEQDGNGSFTLNRGDVVTLVADNVRVVSPFESSPGNDLSLIDVNATKPIQVIMGHVCANIPETEQYCDHIEEVVPPSAALGSEYVVTNFEAAATTSTPKYTLRIARALTDVTVRFEPAIHAPIELNTANPIVDLTNLTGSARLTADAPFLIAQFQQSGRSTEVGDNPESDPSQIYPPPVRQWRSEYRFFASLTFRSYVSIVTSPGTTVEIDGLAVNTLTPLAGTSYVTTQYGLGAGEAGAHHLTASGPVGLVVYGFGFQSSYAYPGGLELTQ